MNTPETDAVLSQYAHHLPNWLATEIVGELAKRLERERDEARSLFESSKHARQSLSDACDHLQRQLAEMAEQRDKWQEEAMRWRDMCGQTMTCEGQLL